MAKLEGTAAEAASAASAEVSATKAAPTKACLLYTSELPTNREV